MTPTSQSRVRAMQLAGVGIFELLAIASFWGFDWRLGVGVFFTMWARNLRKKAG